MLIKKGQIDPKDYVCPDEIVKNEGWDPFSKEDVIKAMQKAEEIRICKVLKGENVVMETVFSHPSKIDYIKFAKEKGYKVIFFFIMTRNVEINKERVKIRVEEGGHPVPFDKIESRFKRSLENMLRVVKVKVIDELFVIDNTQNYKIVAKVDFSSGKVWISEEVLSDETTRETFEKLKEYTSALERKPTAKLSREERESPPLSP